MGQPGVAGRYKQTSRASRAAEPDDEWLKSQPTQLSMNGITKQNSITKTKQNWLICIDKIDRRSQRRFCLWGQFRAISNNLGVSVSVSIEVPAFSNRRESSLPVVIPMETFLRDDNEWSHCLHRHQEMQWRASPSRRINNHDHYYNIIILSNHINS